MAVPGLTPRSPLKLVGPVLLTDWPPSTEKDWAVPSPAGVVTAEAAEENDRATAMAMTATSRALSPSRNRALKSARWTADAGRAGPVVMFIFPRKESDWCRSNVVVRMCPNRFRTY
ncbi:hypothetical protein GCM10009672_09410 [Nesterenkonia lutea]